MCFFCAWNTVVFHNSKDDLNRSTSFKSSWIRKREKQKVSRSVEVGGIILQTSGWGKKRGSVKCYFHTYTHALLITLHLSTLQWACCYGQPMFILRTMGKKAQVGKKNNTHFLIDKSLFTSWYSTALMHISISVNLERRDANVHSLLVAESFNQPFDDPDKTLT